MTDFYSYFYDNANALKNKFGIRNEIMLDSVANDYVSSRMLDFLSEPIPFEFDADYLCRAHKELFGDVFEWAGEYRTCDMARNQSFCSPDLISGEVDAFCERFNQDFLSREFSGKDSLVVALAQSWGDLNKIHPFRDGNGRSQFVFFAMACRSKGYELAPQSVDLQNLRLARDLASMGRSGTLQTLLKRSLVEISSVPVVEKFVAPPVVQQVFEKVVVKPSVKKSFGKCQYDLSDLPDFGDSSDGADFEKSG